MDSDRWKQVDHLLQAALERPLKERDAFLRSACAGDEALEREVRSLLRAQHQAESFLESPAIEAAARAIAQEQRKLQHEDDDFLLAAPCPITALWESWAAVGWALFTRPRTPSLAALSP